MIKSIIIFDLPPIKASNNHDKFSTPLCNVSQPKTTKSYKVTYKETKKQH